MRSGALGHRELQGLLREAWSGVNSKPRPIRLPGWQFEGDLVDLRIVLSDRDAQANMQSDCSAFEGFSLALRRLLGVKTVTLVVPAEVDGSHAKRLKYRASKWAAIFPWFRGPGFTLPSGAILNAESAERTALPVGDDPRSEHELETHLLANRALEKALGLERAWRQLPVGVFEAKVAHESRVFPGGKACVDLFGTKGRVLHIVELKAGDNAKVGALSELFCYANIVRDVQRGAIAMSGKGDVADALRKTTAVEAHLLAAELHPLLDQGMVDELNAGLVRSQHPIRFSLLKLHEGGLSISGHRLAT